MGTVGLIPKNSKIFQQLLECWDGFTQKDQNSASVSNTCVVLDTFRIELVFTLLSDSICFKGNVHVTWRDPLNPWVSTEKDFGDLSTRYSYIGKYSSLHRQMFGKTWNGSLSSCFEDVLTFLLSHEHPTAIVHSSTGYSVLEEQKLLSRDGYTLVTGSPRYESKGAVMFGNKTQKHISQAEIIPGEQVGSYFGHSLAVTDLNNDKCVSTPSLV